MSWNRYRAQDTQRKHRFHIYRTSLGSRVETIPAFNMQSGSRSAMRLEARSLKRCDVAFFSQFPSLTRAISDVGAYMYCSSRELATRVIGKRKVTGANGSSSSSPDEGHDGVDALHGARRTSCRRSMRAINIAKSYCSTKMRRFALTSAAHICCRLLSYVPNRSATTVHCVDIQSAFAPEFLHLLP